MSQRFEQACIYAIRLHAGQVRKRSEVPYIAHLMSVCALVLEAGGDEDQAIAALLHDAVEDQGGYETLDEIRKRFGNRVASIVEGCTDAFTSPKPAWRLRKERYLEHLQRADQDVLLVSIADKLHNARCILLDLKKDGEAVWARFNGGKEGTIWYYRSLVDIYSNYIDLTPMVSELGLVVEQITDLSGSQNEV